jgi:hypothetical protein
MNDCSRYWLHSHYLPIDDVISYWCESDGFVATHCKDAKRAAICTAVDKGQIQYRRSDGKPFDDTAFDLAIKGLLQIERSSFDVWAKQFADAPQLDIPLAKRERETLLTIIAVLCKDAGYDHTKHAKTAGLIQSSADKMGLSIGETTIEGHLKKITDALANRMK